MQLPLATETQCRPSLHLSVFLWKTSILPCFCTGYGVQAAHIVQADEPRAFLHGKYIAMNSCTNTTVSDQLQEKQHSLHPLCLSGPSTQPLQCHPTSGSLQNAYRKLKKAHLSTRQQSSHMNGPNAEQGCHALHHGNRGQDNERTLHIVLATETGLPYR